MRLIDADAFKAYIRNACKEMKHLFRDGGKWAEQVTEDFCKDIDEQPTIDSQKWIPVSERLPDVGQKVLASTNKTCFTQVFKGTSGASNSSWWWEKKTIKHIFAWMPLPEPYKGEEE